MFILAYLLFSNISLMAGMLLVLIAQSRRRGDELPCPRRNRLAPTPFSRPA